MALIDGDQVCYSAISAASTVQTWQWNLGYSRFYIQNLTAGSNTAADTILYFDGQTAIGTASVTAIRLLAGQYIDINFPGPTNTVSVYSTATLAYQMFHF